MFSLLIAKKFILFYLLLFILFRTVFKYVNRYYIKDTAVSPHPIDVHAFVTRKYADRQYMIKAKEQGYDHGRYFRTFLPLDLIYPFFYSLLFFSCLLYCNHPTLKLALTILITAGAILDWSEDLSFSALLLSPSDRLAGVVAFFCTIKTIVFILNLVFCIYWLGVATLLLIKN